MFLNTCFILLETKKTRKNVDLPTTPKELPTTNRLSDLSSCSWWNFLTAWYISSLMSPLHYQAYACWGGVATSPRLMWLVATSSSHCLDKFQASISLRHNVSKKWKIIGFRKDDIYQNGVLLFSVRLVLPLLCCCFQRLGVLNLAKYPY